MMLAKDLSGDTAGVVRYVIQTHNSHRTGNNGNYRRVPTLHVNVNNRRPQVRDKLS